jgi:hypothetical protein
VDELTQAIGDAERNISSQQETVKRLKAERCDPERENKVWITELAMFVMYSFLFYWCGLILHDALIYSLTSPFCPLFPLQLQKLQQLRAENAAMEEELAKNRENDPAELKRVQQEVVSLKAGADRWTDNVWAIKSHLVKKRGMAGKEVDKMLGIDGNFDYLA